MKNYIPSLLLAIIIISAAFGQASALGVDSAPIDDFIKFMKLCRNAPPEMRYALWHKNYYGPNANLLQKVVFKTDDEAKMR